MLYFAPDHASAAELRGAVNLPCPRDSVEVSPGNSIQKVADSAGAFATLCRCRVKDFTEKDIRSLTGADCWPTSRTRAGTGFPTYTCVSVRNMANARPGTRPATCRKASLSTNRPLVPVLTKEAVDVGRFYIDFRSGEIYLADDPNQGQVEVAAAVFAFSSNASNVLIRNIIVENIRTPLKLERLTGDPRKLEHRKRRGAVEQRSWNINGVRWSRTLERRSLQRSTRYCGQRRKRLISTTM